MSSHNFTSEEQLYDYLKKSALEAGFTEEQFMWLWMWVFVDAVYYPIRKREMGK